jgi:hypothetical protein
MENLVRLWVGKRGSVNERRENRFQLSSSILSLKVLQSLVINSSTLWSTKMRFRLTVPKTFANSLCFLRILLWLSFFIHHSFYIGVTMTGKNPLI